MAACSSCGEPLRDDAWVCGACGAPVVAAGGQAQSCQYAETSVASLPTAPPTVAAKGLTNLIKLVLLGGLVALAAIVALWFFVLRSNVDTFFVGTWTSDSGVQFRIARAGNDLQLFVIEKDGKSVGPFKTTMKGGALETSLEPARGSDEDKATANLARAMMAAMMGPSRVGLEFRKGADNDHATISLPGVSGGGAGSLTREQ
jgi:hypothetical protein